MQNVCTASTSRAGVCLALGIFAVVRTQSATANSVVEWNEIAVATVRKPDWPLLRRERTLAMTQLAVFEATNAIRPQYVASQIAVHGDTGASLRAAVVEAAYRVLLNQVPDDSISLAAQRARSMAVVAAGKARSDGETAGALAAQSVLNWRANDGADWTPTYHPRTAPGAYQPTSTQPMDAPLAAHMKPFALRSISQFRVAPPPAITSAEFARDLKEVHDVGGMRSGARSADQTAQGLFFQTPGFYPWNEIARKAIVANNLDESSAAHVLMLLDVGIMDVQLAAWDAKYAYDAWRPVTAIHAGGAPDSAPDPDWMPLIPTPMHPEYTCGHCTTGAAARTIMSAIFGSKEFAFDITQNGSTRHFLSFEHFSRQESNARLYAGVHFRYSMRAGEDEGKKVAHYVLSAAAKPIRAR